MDFLIKLIVGFFNSIFKDLLAQKEAEDKGAAKQVIKTEKEADAIFVKAQSARDSVIPVTVDNLPSHTPENDPDFRD